MHRRTAAVTILILALALVAPVSGAARSTPAAEETATLIAAGDIASCEGDGDEQTAALVEDVDGTVAMLGDGVYPSATDETYRDCYDPSWGAFKDRTRPTPGNHDYMSDDGASYFAYFGDAAGEPDKGWYSYDLGAWHIVVLNSNLDMAAGSEQEQWLRDDLADHPAACTLAYWHYPRFSSGATHGDNWETQPLWDALYEAGAEIVLAGHEHSFERFAPQTPDGDADPAHGIAEFIVGTGGIGFHDFDEPRPNSEVRQNEALGVLELTLRPDGYDWRFLPVDGGDFSDSGSGACHGAPTSDATATPA